MPPFLLQRRQVALKIEAVSGTAETLAAADVVAPVFDVEYTPTVEMFEREVIQPSFSRLTQIPGERSAVISFSTELKGSGAAGTPPPNLSSALQACGFGETIVASTSVTYAPASVDIPSLTIEVREGAIGTEVRVMQIVGARGTMSLEATKGQPVLLTFEFTGKYVEPSDPSALLVNPAITPLPIAFLNAAFDYGGVSTLKVSAVTLDIGNDVQLRNDANDASGNLEAVITGRSPTGSMDPEMELIATINFYNLWTTPTEGLLNFLLGATPGNITDVTAPKAQITTVAEGDRDGLVIASLDLQLSQSVAIGDDELVIAFT